MALVGPIVTGDLDVGSIVRSIRNETTLKAETASFQINPREAQTYRVSGATATVIVKTPATTGVSAGTADFKIGSQWLLINDSGQTMSFANNADTAFGRTVPNNTSAILTLLSVTGASDTNGTWSVIEISGAGTVDKFGATFNANATGMGASWAETSSGSGVFETAFDIHDMVGSEAIPVVYTTEGTNPKVVLIDTTTETRSARYTLVLKVPGSINLFAGEVFVV